MKKIFLIVCAAVLAGCTSKSSASTAEAENNESNSETVETTASVNKFTLDSFHGVQVSSTVERGPLTKEDVGARVIGKIITKDGYDNYWGDVQEYGAPYTYGTFEVIKDFDGTLQEGEVYPFAIAGGIVSWENYAKGQVKESLEKQVYLANKNGSGVPDTVDTTSDLTPIEPGYTYFMVMSPLRPVHGDLYVIYPLEDTFMPVAEETLNENSSKAYNLELGEWENIETALEATAPINE